MRRGDRRNATVVDVAERAQVSVATVSRVVNGNYAVRPSTRDRVLEAIDALHYVPNVQARELNLRHSTTIGVVVPSLYNMFFAEVIDGIEATVRQYHYSLIFNCAKNDPQQEVECVRALVSRNVAGIIVISPNTAHIESDFYESVVARTPLVFINNGWQQIHGASYVDNDERAGSRKALEYLMGLGHQRILFVRGVNSDSYTVKEESYRQLMQEKGWLDEQFIVNIGEGNSIDTVEHTADTLQPIIAKLRPTAVFCCNDLMGIGAQNACQRLGLRVPEDISVLGYDNSSLARLVEPKLTTMDQNMHQLGQNAVSLLLDSIKGARSRHITLQNTLVERRSVASCRKSED